MAANENLYWYDRNGTRIYSIVGKNGKERKATLRDAKTHGYYPPVNKILRVAAKPELENWKKEQALLSALTLPRLPGESEISFMRRAIEDSQKESQETAMAGARIHKAIEDGFMKGVMSPIFIAVRNSLIDSLGEQQWIAEKSFVHEDGFGGTVDLYCEKIIVDFKTKDNLQDKDPNKLVYDEYGMQLAAYSHGLMLHRPKRVSVFIDRKDHNLIKSYVWGEDSYDRHLQMFLTLLQYWKLSNKFCGEYHDEKC